MQQSESRIVTSHVFPPIPMRSHDWCAYHENDVEDLRRYGWGPTEVEALKDLAERLYEEIDD